MRLIKTAIDIVDLDKNQDCIVLGDWCLKGLEDVLGSDNKYNKVPYHWDNREKFNQDYYYLSNLYERSLKELSATLNVMHNLNADIRYWRIIIGPWLRFFIDSVFDRYEIIRTATKNKEYLEIRTFSYNLEDWVPKDFQEFYDDFRDDEWNEIIFSECLRSLEIDSLTNSKNLLRLPKGESKSLIKKIISPVLAIYEYILPKLFNKIIVVKAYAPIKVILKLHLKLKQFPYFNEIKVDDIEIDFKKRERFSLSNPKNQFEFFLSNLLGKHIPKVYVEGYRDLRQKTLKRYPKDPKLIFTSNAYQADEGFKFLAAEKTARKSKLIIGQHGGHFGIGLHNQTEDHQLKISDHFISWGWKRNGYSNIISLPSIKLSSNNIVNNNSRKFLFIAPSFPRYFFCHYSMPVGGQFLECVKSQINFIKKLNKRNFKNTYIRLDASGDEFGWNMHEILRINGLQGKITNAEKPLMGVLKNYNLCVCNNNATVFLETLALNFPTIIYLDSRFYEIRPESIEPFNVLKECGILHNNSDSAAAFLNDISDNIPKWWNSDEVKNARKLFTKSFANSSSIEISLKSMSSFLEKNILSDHGKI